MLLLYKVYSKEPFWFSTEHCWIASTALLVLNRTLLNSIINALLVLNRTLLKSVNVLLILNDLLTCWDTSDSCQSNCSYKIVDWYSIIICPSGSQQNIVEQHIRVPFWFSTEHCWTASTPFWFSTEHCWTASTPFWFSTEHCWIALKPFWFSTEHCWTASSTPFWFSTEHCWTAFRTCPSVFSSEHCWTYALLVLNRTLLELLRLSIRNCSCPKIAID